MINLNYYSIDSEEEIAESDGSGEQDDDYEIVQSDILPEYDLPISTSYRKRRSPDISIFTSHQSVNPFTNFGFTSTTSSCRDGPNFHECTTVTNNGGNRRNGQGTKKTVITKVIINQIAQNDSR